MKQILGWAIISLVEGPFPWVLLSAVSDIREAALRGTSDKTGHNAAAKTTAGTDSATTKAGIPQITEEDLSLILGLTMSN